MLRPLWFSVDDATLATIYETMSRICPAALYPRAWDIVMKEMESRKAENPPGELKLPSGVFDTLPTEVQDVLRPHAVPYRRRTA